MSFPSPCAQPWLIASEEIRHLQPCSGIFSSPLPTSRLIHSNYCSTVCTGRTRGGQAWRQLVNVLRKQCQAILVVFKLHLSSSDSRFSSFVFVNMCVYLEKHFWRRGKKACSSSPFLRCLGCAGGVERAKLGGIAGDLWGLPGVRVPQGRDPQQALRAH